MIRDYEDIEYAIQKSCFVPTQKAFFSIKIIYHNCIASKNRLLEISSGGLKFGYLLNIIQSIFAE